MVIKKQIAKFDWKITAKKVGIESAKVIVAGLLVLWQDDVRFLAIIPLLKGIENWLKNKNK
jgi:hypothetical protein